MENVDHLPRLIINQTILGGDQKQSTVCWRLEF